MCRYYFYLIRQTLESGRAVPMGGVLVGGVRALYTSICLFTKHTQRTHTHICMYIMCTLYMINYFRI